ncbi:hypothetical protein PS6_002330 [Mucor atramentarius]
MYFDEVISGEWDLDKAVIYYKQQAENVSPIHQIGNDLNTVIHSRPNYTEQSRNKAKELFKSYNGKEAERSQSIVINDNHGTISNYSNTTTTIINKDVGEKRKHSGDVMPSTSKNKMRPVEEEDRPVEEEDRFWDKWIRFIKNAQTNPDLHRFACERHGVLRLGHGINNNNLSDEDYSALKTCLLETNTNCIPDVINGVESHLYEILDIVDAEQLLFKIKWPGIKSTDADYLSSMQFVQEITISIYNFAYKQNLAVSLEQSYRDVLIFPLLKACVNIISNDSLLFIPGEVPLESMTAQLANSKKILAPNEKYYADGVISYLKNEICIYEASGPFGANEKSKQNFDFHKALFGLLSCIATIAQSYSYATLETFSKLKLYFVQTKGSSIQLWYLRHLQDNTYVIARETKLKLSNDKERYADTVLDCLQFAGLFKNRLNNTMGIINELISEHNKMSIMRRTRRNASTESPPQQLLSAIIKPTIIKLTESKHSKEMHKLGPDSFLDDFLFEN